MKNDFFPELFQKACELALDYDVRKEALPARGTADQVAIRNVLGGHLPEAGQDGLEVISELAAGVEPGLTGTTTGRFFGWVIGGSHPVGRAADWLTSTWAQNSPGHVVSPASAAVEETVGEWIKSILGLPPSASFGITTGATMANFTAMVTARSHLYTQIGWSIEEDGYQRAPRFNVIVGDDVHTTVLGGLRYMGVGMQEIHRVSTDDQGRMQVPSLKEYLKAIEGPCLVLAQAGQINTGAMDPFADIVALCRDHGAWVHIDGAFGLWANASESLRENCAGLAEADSWSVDGHKWLQIPYDCGFVMVKHAQSHQNAMSMNASYLPLQGGYDASNYVPELSRRSRGFAVWAVMKALGRKGIVDMIETHCHLTQLLAQRLAAVDGISILNEVTLNQLAVWFGSDALTIAVLDELKKENRFLLGGATWQGKEIMRVSVISWQVEETEIHQLADDIIRIYGTLKQS